MKRIVATSLIALGLVAGSAPAFAQSGYPSGYQNGYGGGYESRQDDTYYDYARVVRVDPVLDGGYRSTSDYSNGVRCYETTTAGSYQRGGYYGNGGYARNDGYYRDDYGYGGSQTGRNVATIVGGIAGAVLGSKVGGGSGTYAATAIGSMVGGMAGRGIYDQSQRDRYTRPASVRVCDPQPVGRYGDQRYGDYRTGSASAYDVTYEYNGRQYTRRMDHHPGDRVRVRVDVSPE